MPTIHTADNATLAKTSHSNLEKEATIPYLCMQVKTDRMQHEGMYFGDTLLIDKQATPTNGCLLVLNFDGKLVLRKLEMCQSSLMLHALHGLTQTIEWPAHQPLPIVGVVKKIIRTM